MLTKELFSKNKMSVLNFCKEAKMKNGFIFKPFSLCLMLNDAPLANTNLRPICAEYVTYLRIMENW